MGFYKTGCNRLLQCCSGAPARFLQFHVISKLFKTAVEASIEVMLIVVFLVVYNFVRNQFGSQKCSPLYALTHAMQVIRLEQLLGIFWEQEVQAMVLKYPLFIGFWNIFYGSAHMVVTVFVLLYLFFFKPAAYQRCRTIFLVMNVLALAGYAGYPLMPPRLINDCSDPYGGCLKEPQFHFVDTLHEYGGLWSWKNKGITKVSNQYAAMPSMHAGYSSWCSTSIYKHSQSPVLKVLAIIYPVLTLYCIMVTANHYPLDAVFGLLALCVATKVAAYLPEVGRGAVSAGSYLVNLKSSDPDIEVKVWCSSPSRPQSMQWSTIHRNSSSGTAQFCGSGDVEAGGQSGELATGVARDHKGRPLGSVKKR